MKSLPFLLAAVFFFFSILKNADAQSLHCGFDEIFDVENDPRIEAFDEQLRQHILEKNLAKGATAPPYVVPVVVHLIHNGGAENLPSGQILQAIQNLNDGFAASGYFAQKGATENTQIQFCLARRDPDGNATDGINRVQSPLSDFVMETEDLQVKNLSRWQPKDYLNIWVVREISSTGLGTGVAGYAVFPTEHGKATDGVVVEAKFFGTSPAEDVVLIHEVGHYLGLYHTFQSACFNSNCAVQGDRVCDTPPDAATHTVCDFNSCSTDVTPGSPFTSDVPDFTGDFMDYSPFDCYAFFTAGQTVRMHASLETTRKSLLVSLGCVDACSQPLDAAFSMSPNPATAGQTVSFSNTSSSSATNFSWSSNGVVFSQNQNPTQVFTAPGSYQIELTASNADPNCVDKTEATLVVECPVVADFTASKLEIDPGGTVNFTNSSSGGTLVFDWFINGFSVGTSQNFSFQFQNAGTYAVTLRAAGLYCYREKTVLILVKAPCSQLADARVSFKMGNEWFGHRDMEALPDGSVIGVGNHAGKPFFARFDANGQIIWQKRIENQGVLEDIEPLPNGDFVLYGDLNKKVFMTRIDADGNLIWAKTLQNPSGISSTLSGADKMAINPDGSFGFLVDGGNGIILIGKVRLDGTLEWVSSVHGCSAMYSIELATDGTDDFLYATFTSDANNPHPAIGRATQTGKFLKLQKFSLPQFKFATFSQVYLGAHPNGDFSMIFFGNTGNSNLQMEKFIARCSPEGQPIFCKMLQSPNLKSIYMRARYRFGEGWFLSDQKSNANSTHAGNYFFAYGDDDKLLWNRQVGSPGQYNQDVQGAVRQGGYVRALMNTEAYKSIELLRLPDSDAPVDCLPTTPLVETETDMAIEMKEIVGSLTPRNFPLTDENVQVTNLQLIRTTLCQEALPCPEICDNELDDDQNGWVDCFDPVCFCLPPDTTGCYVVPEVPDFSIKLGWESSQDLTFPTFTPMVANLDPQRGSVPEILICGRSIPDPTKQSIFFYQGDGSNKDNPQWLEPPNNIQIQDPAQLAIADVDRNGVPEIIVPTYSGRIYVYTDFDPAATPCMRLWCASTNLSSYGIRGMLSVADFDADGVPEIYYGAEIFKFDLTNAAAPTLRQVLKGSGHSGFSSSGIKHVSSTAADVLSVADCAGDPDCAGLELIAGCSIYSLDLAVDDGDGLQIKEKLNLNSLDPTSNVYEDGKTAVADMDLDGQPEVIVNSKLGTMHGVLVWNKSGLKRFYPINDFNPPFGSGGILLIANVFDDRTAGFQKDLPEIVVIGQDRVFCFNENKAKQTPNQPAWWTLSVFDASGRTGATAYDFNGDGVLEIVYRDEQHLRILYGGAAPFPAGVDAERNWARVIAGSTTGDEYPIVADVDNDNQAEIVVSSHLEPHIQGQPGTSTWGRLRVFESADLPWLPARPVWNQYNFFNVHVNDDLTVPKVQQKHWLEIGGKNSGKYPFNTHLAMAPSLLNPLITNKLKVPDATLALDSSACRLDSFLLDFEICNLGNEVLPAGTPLAFYLGDPTKIAAPLLFPPLIFSEKLKIGECRKISFSIPATVNQKIFAVVNDDGSVPRPFNLEVHFPSTNQPECFFENNILEFEIKNLTPKLDLGDDISLCKNSVVELAADPNFQKYRWQDGSSEPNFTAFSPGKYWVDCFDACGFRQTDTVVITLKTLPNTDLPDQISLCEGDSISLAAAGFDQYSWSPADSVACPNCPAVQILAKKSFTLHFTAGDGTCFVSDSVRVEIFEKPQVNLISKNGNCGQAASIAPQISGTTPFQFEWSNATTDSVLTTTQSGVYVVKITDANGCETLDSAAVSVFENLETSANFEQPKCAGEASGSIDLSIVGGTPPFQFSWSNGATTEDLTNLKSGNYTVSASDAAGCTSSFSVVLDEPPPLEIDFLKIDGDCDSPAELTANCSVGQPPFKFQWSDGSQNPTLTATKSGTYAVTATDANGCTVADSAAVKAPPPLVLAVAASQNPRCAGGSDGSISLEILTGTQPVAFSWTGASPASGDTPSGLSAGEYFATATDAEGCTATFFVKLEEPLPLVLDFEKTDLNCPGDTGFVKIMANGGTPPVEIEWSDGSLNFEINLTQSGTYTATATDANGCEQPISVEILTLGAAPILTSTTDTLSCAKTVGQISVAADLPNTSFSWTGSGGFSSTAAAPQVFQNGQFSVTATSAAGGCTAVATVEVALDTAAPILKISKKLVEIPCDSTSVELSAAGSSSGQNFEIEWMASAGGSILQGDKTLAPTVGAAGFYFLKISNLKNGCAASGEVEVVVLDKPTAAEIAVDSARCAGEASGSVSILKTTGGTPPMIYSIENQPFVSDSVFQNLAAGTYFLKIKDAHDCLFETQFEVGEPPAVAVNLSGDSLVVAGGAASLTAEIVGSSQPPASIFWSPPGLFSNQNLLVQQVRVFENTLFSIQIENENGCSDTASWLIRVDRTRRFFAPNVVQPGSIGNGIFTIFGDANFLKIRNLQVFDRWGELLFENRNFAPNDFAEGWDGTFRGKNLPPQVLVWQTEIEFSDGVVSRFSGSLTLLK